MPARMSPVLVPDFEIRINGQSMVEAERDLRSIRVEQRIDTLSMFALTLDNWAAERQTVSWSDSSVFDVGAEVEIRLGWMNRLTKVMTGEITGIEPRFSADDPASVTIRGYDLGHRLTRTWRTRSYTRMKDSQIASQVASRAGLNAAVTNTEVTHEHVLQSNQTDLDFLRARARTYGWEVFVRDRTLNYRAPAIAPVAGAGDDGRGRAQRVRAATVVDGPGVRGGHPGLGREGEEGDHRRCGSGPAHLHDGREAEWPEDCREGIRRGLAGEHRPRTVQ